MEKTVVNKNFTVKDAICITPVDEDIKLRAESVKILNWFKERGFDKRSNFISLVQNNLSQFKEYKEVKKLEVFWSGRNASSELNSTLMCLIEKLKAE